MEEKGYNALLQPLRDLAANWEVDIAESLSEYVEDLSRLEVSIDGGKSTLNFAQAALLIQGSTAVYSKKVEYLHTLVLQALELMSERKASAKQEAGAGQGGANGARKEKAKLSALEDERFLFGGDPTYLMLDDFLDEAHNIDLDSNQDDARLKDKRRSSVRLLYSATTYYLAASHTSLNLHRHLPPTHFTGTDALCRGRRLRALLHGPNALPHGRGPRWGEP